MDETEEGKCPRLGFPTGITRGIPEYSWITSRVTLGLPQELFEVESNEGPFELDVVGGYG